MIPALLYVLLPRSPACEPSEQVQLVVPDHDGAVVATGARLVWRYANQDVWGDAGIVLRDEAGGPVAFTWSCAYDLCVATVDDPEPAGATLTLEASTNDNYPLIVEFVYGEDGTFPVPTAPAVHGVTFTYQPADPGNDCGRDEEQWAVGAWVDAPWGGDGAGVVDVFTEGGILWDRGLAGQGLSVGETLPINVDSLCVYAVTYNGQGQASEPSATVCGAADPGDADPGDADPGDADPGEADRGDVPGGCSTMPVRAAIPGMVLALLAAPRRRRYAKGAELTHDSRPPAGRGAMCRMNGMIGGYL